MRSSTRNIVSSIGLGTLALSYVVGLNSSTASGLSASGLAPTTVDPTATDQSSAAASSSPTASSSESASPSASASSSAKKSSSTSSKSNSSSSSGSSSSNSSGSSSSNGNSSSGSSSTGSSSSSVTKSSGSISYRYGVIEISATKSGGKVTDIQMVQSDATHGCGGAFSPLIQAAISAQGSSFGNVGGCTFTTDAFKQAVDSVFGKF